MVGRYHFAIPRLPKPPRLDNPACASLIPLFDATMDGRNEAAEREALNVCRTCPERKPCQDWYWQLPKGKRPLGVTAGLVYRPRMQRQMTEPTVSGAPVTFIQPT